MKQRKENGLPLNKPERFFVVEPHNRPKRRDEKRNAPRSVRYAPSDSTKRWMIYFDGACEPYNPGGVATYGFTLHTPDGKLLVSGKGFICEGPGATNNVAEYGALEAALKYLLAEDIKGPITCRGDSKLVICTVQGVWCCHKPHIAAARDRIWRLIEQLGRDCKLEWVPREHNTEADALTSQAYVEWLTKDDAQNEK